MLTQFVCYLAFRVVPVILNPISLAITYCWIQLIGVISGPITK